MPVHSVIIKCMSTLVIGSRGSQLALHQTNLVIGWLKALYPDLECRIEVIKTTGDKNLDVPLAKIGDKGLFVKEIEQALFDGSIDCAVHSAKDLPSEMDERLIIAAYPEREDPADVLVSRCGKLEELPAGANIGTSSLRRRAQILNRRPDLNILDLRGNLDTRLRKLDTDNYDAIVLAGAGLRRLGWESRITQFLPFDICLPMAGQGALAIQCRNNDPAVELITKLDSCTTRRCVTAERTLLAYLGAGCQTPVAALAQEIDGELKLEACVASTDGSRIVRMKASGDVSSPEEVGKRLAEQLLESPAKELLEEVRQSTECKGLGAA